MSGNSVCMTGAYHLGWGWGGLWVYEAALRLGQVESFPLGMDVARGSVYLFQERGHHPVSLLG